MPDAAPRITAMTRSGIRDIMDLAASHPDVIHLEVGQPDFATPAHIVEAGCAAAAAGYTTYTANRGLYEVRETMAEKLRRENGIVVDPHNVVITCGAVNGLFESLAAVLSPGDAVLVPDPGWPNYAMMVEALNARLVRYPLRAEDGYLPDLTRLGELARAERAKVLLINSPSNPTGAVFPQTVMQGFVEIAQRNDLWLISDECYERIVFDGEHVSPARFDEDGRVISVFSMSKTYAMTGWRIGYVVGTSAVIDQIAKVQEPVVSCATAMAQKASQAALAGDQSCVVEMTAAYRARRDLVVDQLAAANMLVSRPAGAFYIIADISAAAEDSYSFARRLVAEHAVAVAPGLTFGPSGNRVVRLSLATATDQLAEGVERLVAAVAGDRAFQPVGD